MGRIAVRDYWPTLASVGMAVGIIWLLIRFQVISIATLANVFHTNSVRLILVFFLAVLLFVFGVFRYHFSLKAIGYSADFKIVCATSLASAAIGQWLPGSMASAEIFRFAMMLGVANLGTTETSERSRGVSLLVMASVLDRVLGLLAFHLLSASSLVVLPIFERYYAVNVSSIVYFVALLYCVLVSFSLVFLLVAPSFSWVQRLSLSRQWALNLADKRVFARFKILLVALTNLVVNVFHAASCMNRTQATMALGMGLAGALISASSLGFAAESLGGSVQWILLMAGYAPVAASTLVPLGFGGLGGNQLVTAIVYRSFSFDASLMASASLLQNVVFLVVGIVMGGAVFLLMFNKTWMALRSVFGR